MITTADNAAGVLGKVQERQSRGKPGRAAATGCLARTSQRRLPFSASSSNWQHSRLRSGWQPFGKLLKGTMLKLPGGASSRLLPRQHGLWCPGLPQMSASGQQCSPLALTSMKMSLPAGSLRAKQKLLYHVSASSTRAVSQHSHAKSRSK